MVIYLILFYDAMSSTLAGQARATLHIVGAVDAKGGGRDRGREGRAIDLELSFASPSASPSSFPC